MNVECRYVLGLGRARAGGASAPLVYYCDSIQADARRPWKVSWRDGALVCLEGFAREAEARAFAAGEPHPRAGRIGGCHRR